LVKVITRRKNLENVPGVMQKGPTNTVNVSAIEGRGENVFLRVDTYPIIPYIR
jgi:nitrogen regulatory protein PII